MISIQWLVWVELPMSRWASEQLCGRETERGRTYGTKTRPVHAILRVPWRRRSQTLNPQRCTPWTCLPHITDILQSLYVLCQSCVTATHTYSSTDRSWLRGRKGSDKCTETNKWSRIEGCLLLRVEIKWELIKNYKIWENTVYKVLVPEYVIGTYLLCCSANYRLQWHRHSIKVPTVHLAVVSSFDPLVKL